MADYDWTQFHVHMYYLAPIEDVFARFATSAGLESFFVRLAEFTTTEGVTRLPAEQYEAGDRYHLDYVHSYSHGGKCWPSSPIA